ncbi:MAG: transferrin receptor-like dimerization domain-containing protein, partial [Gemmatimonadales bacterium]
LGIPSLDLGFGGETKGGIYHSIYDDFNWYTHYSDTSFVYGRALAQTVGTAVMRLADAELLPYEFGDLAETVRGYVTELKQLAASEADAARERNTELSEGAYAATSDPWHPTIAPPADSVPPHFNFAPLDNGTDALTRSAERYAAALARARARLGGIPAVTLARVNTTLLQSERALTDAQGLPGRPWYVHQLYAPGYYTGYGVKTMPAVREAIEQHKFTDVDGAAARVAAVLRAEAAVLDEAVVALGGT